LSRNITVLVIERQDGVKLSCTLLTSHDTIEYPEI